MDMFADSWLFEVSVLYRWLLSGSDTDVNVDVNDDGDLVTAQGFKIRWKRRSQRR